MRKITRKPDPNERERHAEFKRLLDEHRLTYTDAATLLGACEKTIYRKYNRLSKVKITDITTLAAKLQGRPKP